MPARLVSTHDELLSFNLRTLLQKKTSKYLYRLRTYVVMLAKLYEGGRGKLRAIAKEFKMEDCFARLFSTFWRFCRCESFDVNGDLL